MLKHLLDGIFRFAIAQGHPPKGTMNPVLLTVLPEPSRTVVAVAAFTRLRAGEIRGLSWQAYVRPNENDEDSLGSVLVLHSIWRGRVGEPKNSRSKATVPLIPQLAALL